VRNGSIRPPALAGLSVVEQHPDAVHPVLGVAEPARLCQHGILFADEKPLVPMIPSWVLRSNHHSESIKPAAVDTSAKQE